DSAWATLQHDRWPMPYLRARALLRLGRRLRRAGRNDTARVVLHAALEGFEAMPAPAWADRARDAIRATGERLPASGRRSVELLTPQETDELMGIMRQLREAGTAIVFITHKLREVRAVADRITV
ncbi:hypothetical protein IAE22_32295, partial [Bacillus sp. S34]|nr:hypothetical protein [Bacillus sp. S34]